MKKDHPLNNDNEFNDKFYNTGTFHLLNYMNIDKKVIQDLGVLLLLPELEPEKVSSTKIKYGNTSDIYGTITHATHIPLIISARLHLKGLFTEKENRSEDIKGDIASLVQKYDIWREDLQVIQYSGYSYMLEDSKSEDYSNIRLGITIDR